jgi:serine protease Do
VYNQLSQHGKVTRGSIGIQYHPTRDVNELEAYGLKGPEAIIVDAVYPGSPAEKAGLKEHDVITEIDGIKLTTGNQLQDYIVDRPIGATVRLGWIHDGKSQSAGVTIGDRTSVLAENTPAESAPARRNRDPLDLKDRVTSSHIGISVEPLTTQMMRQFSFRGVQVTKVEEKGAADEAGLSEGMIITGAVSGGRPVEISSVADFSALDARLKAGSGLVLTVRVPDNQFARDVSFTMKVK